MKAVVPNREANGLRLDLNGDPPLRRLKADHGGIYFWDKKGIVLDDLGSYLAKVEQSGSSVLFTKLDANHEVCANSTPLGSRKVRREVHDDLSAALRAFKGRVNDSTLDVDAVRLIQAFRLPNPVKLPEFYRLYRGHDGRDRLVILWGCDRYDEDSVALEDVPNLLGRRSWLSEVIESHKKLLFIALALIALIMVALLYLSWPRPVVAVSKLEISPGEPFMLTFGGTQGRQFAVQGADSEFRAADDRWHVDHEQVTRLEISNGWFPASKPDIAQLEGSFSTPGEKSLAFTSSTRFLGIPLPTQTRNLKFNVKEIRSLPRPSDANVIGSVSKLSGRLSSPEGAFPATVQFLSPMGGVIDFDNNENGTIEAGRPLEYRNYQKPGLYKVTVKDSSTGTDETLYLRVPPGPGNDGLVSNLRLSKNDLKLGERLVADASSSYHHNPIRKIVSKRLSLDGGETFEEMEGDYAVIPATKSGTMNLVLEAQDDAGSVSRDSGSVSIAEEEAPPLPSWDEIGATLPDGTRGVEIPTDLLFQRGEADISEAGRVKLLDFAKKVASSGTRIEIVGHTDNLPITGSLRSKFADNKALSLARARSAARLMESQGVPADRITCQGKGDEQPVAKANNENARALNRRIQIFFLDAQPSLTRERGAEKKKEE